MNYHLLIDHFFTDNFIDIAEKVAPNKNTYVFTFKLPAKYVKSDKGIISPYGSDTLKNIIESITIHDRVYVHWFHNDVMQVIDALDVKVPVYLFFWGGDFLGYDPFSSVFNFDTHTQKIYSKNIKEIEKVEKSKLLYKSKNPIKLSSMLWDYLRYKKVKQRKGKIDFSIRKRFLKRLNFFCHWNSIDFDIIKEMYGCNPVFLDFFYGGADLEKEFVYSLNKKGYTSIWLGNSDTETNNHLDAIFVLKNFANNPIKIICPLSYGVSPKYGDYITAQGNVVFENKWQSIRDFMPYEAYISLFKDIDIVVMYHNRSQAAGNVMVMIKMGMKVFLKSQSSLFQLFVNLGILVFDANSIKDLSFEDFSKPLTKEQAESNSEKISEYFSENNRNKYFDPILN